MINLVRIQNWSKGKRRDESSDKDVTKLERTITEIKKEDTINVQKGRKLHKSTGGWKLRTCVCFFEGTWNERSFR